MKEEKKKIKFSRKKVIRILIIAGICILGLIIAAALTLYFTNPKFLIKHNDIERVYIYHNELKEERYVFTNEEREALQIIIDGAKIGKNCINDYVPTDGGPEYSFICELKNGQKVQVYCCGVYIYLNGVPFAVDEDTATHLSALHIIIDDKVPPLTEEEYQTIIENR